MAFATTLASHQHNTIPLPLTNSFGPFLFSFMLFSILFHPAQCLRSATTVNPDYISSFWAAGGEG